MITKRVYEDGSPELAVQRLRSGYMLMTMMAARLVEQAEKVNNKDMTTIAQGVLECLKMAKEHADQLEVQGAS